MEAAISHEQEMTRQKQRDEADDQDFNNQGGFKMTNWGNRMGATTVVAKPNWLSIILKHEEIFKLKKFCNEQKKIQKDAGVKEEEEQEQKKKADKKLDDSVKRQNEASPGVRLGRMTRKSNLPTKGVVNQKSSYGLRAITSCLKKGSSQTKSG